MKKKEALLGDDVHKTYFKIGKTASFVMPQVEDSSITLTGTVHEKLTDTKLTFTKNLLYEDNWSIGDYKDELNPTGKVGISSCNVRLDYEITARPSQ